jgi:hypothetical protein
LKAMRGQDPLDVGRVDQLVAVGSSCGGGRLQSQPRDCCWVRGGGLVAARDREHRGTRRQQGVPGRSRKGRPDLHLRWLCLDRRLPERTRMGTTESSSPPTSPDQPGRPRTAARSAWRRGPGGLGAGELRHGQGRCGRDDSHDQRATGTGETGHANTNSDLKTVRGERSCLAVTTRHGWEVLAGGCMKLYRCALGAQLSAVSGV